MRQFIILQFNTLDVLIENAKRRNRPPEIDNLSRKTFEYYPPYAHVNFLFPPQPGKCDPADPDTFAKVIITHSKEHKFVRVESVKIPVNGQFHLFLECSEKELEKMRLIIAGIMQHQQDTYCSITIPNALCKYFLFKTTPGFLQNLVLPLPDYKQRGWHCSELCTFLLQAGGLISRHLYPFFISPTELFLICYRNPRCVHNINFKTVFKPPAIEGWENHYEGKTEPFEITAENCLGVAYFRSYHENTSTDST